MSHQLPNFTDPITGSGTGGHTGPNAEPITDSEQACVSVIIPVFNSASYLEKCLDSLLSQSLESLEFLCVNDASSDNSLSILNDYARKDSRIKIYSFEENRGVASCRNFGLAEARGEYIGFVDSDDWIDADFYEKLYARAKSGNYDLVKAGVYLTYDDGTRILSQYNQKIVDTLKHDKFLAMVNQNEFWTHLYRKSFLQNIHAEFPSLINGEDTVFLLHVLLHKPTFSLIEDTFYYYRQRQNSAYHSHSMPNISATFSAYGMQATLLNESQIPQSDYMEYYCYHVYDTMLFYYQKVIFEKLTNQEHMLCLLYIFDNIQKCKYLDDFFAYPVYSFLKKYVKQEPIPQSTMLLFLKEFQIGQRNLTSSYYKYWLHSKLSKGKRREYYNDKYLICKKIIQLEQYIALKNSLGE